jgi:RNA polymerase sigma-70 factor (ECF subfamily)
MRQIAQGDERALADLYARWSRPLHHFLNGMCCDRTLAEDLVQEVFMRVWRAAPRYEPTAKFSTWIFHVARNHWLNEREKRLHRIRPLSLDRASSDPDEAPIDAADPNAPTPAESALTNELGSRIETAVSRLPEKLRETWILAVGRGLPYPDVAEILGIPVGTVKSRMFQAVRHLRGELAPYVSAGEPPAPETTPS